MDEPLVSNIYVYLCDRYWFLRNFDRKPLPIGAAVRRYTDDVKRVWPGPGREGLVLLQVGATVPIADEPHIRLSL